LPSVADPGRVHPGFEWRILTLAEYLLRTSIVVLKRYRYLYTSNTPFSKIPVLHMQLVDENLGMDCAQKNRKKYFVLVYWSQELHYFATFRATINQPTISSQEAASAKRGFHRNGVFVP
jgi:hypothetical protein